MEKVNREDLQRHIDAFAGKEVYVHLETTNGSYAAHFNEGFFNAGAFIRNVQVRYELGKVVGDSPHRVGLKLPYGWVYAQGITHYEIDEYGRLLMAGFDGTGKLAVALELSETPFAY
ncbi:YojF family protein [Bhargavaea cecembensis]|uniref:YojF family protein n=1 Tax=Bhargavaea cecembensis TaxID=394098 RepID=UPI00058EFA13|nr:YojF family protein [Bhargavaea cecembensis]